MDKEHIAIQSGSTVFLRVQSRQILQETLEQLELQPEGPPPTVPKGSATLGGKAALAKGTRASSHKKGKRSSSKIGWLWLIVVSLLIIGLFLLTLVVVGTTPTEYSTVSYTSPLEGGGPSKAASLNAEKREALLSHEVLWDGKVHLNWTLERSFPRYELEIWQGTSPLPIKCHNASVSQRNEVPHCVLKSADVTLDYEFLEKLEPDQNYTLVLKVLNAKGEPAPILKQIIQGKQLVPRMSHVLHFLFG